MSTPWWSGHIWLDTRCLYHTGSKVCTVFYIIHIAVVHVCYECKSTKALYSLPCQWVTTHIYTSIDGHRTIHWTTYGSLYYSRQSVSMNSASSSCFDSFLLFITTGPVQMMYGVYHIITYLWPDLRKPDIMMHFWKSRFLHQ